MLAYLFWHRSIVVDLAAYEDALGAFHRVLELHPPAGFNGSWSVRIDGPPWFEPGELVYLDAYLVDDWVALGRLNEAAVAEARERPHDVVAGLAFTGAGGISQLVAGGRPREAPTSLAFATKPARASYADYLVELERAAGTGDVYLDPHPSQGTTVWQRQMTLGPGPEFMIGGIEHLPALPGEVERVPTTVIWPLPRA